MTTAAKLQRVADTKELLREAINEALTLQDFAPMPAGVPFKGYSMFVGQLGSGEINPATLFSSGEPGVWFDPSDPATLFTDTAGTTQAQIGDPVALVLDKSGNGNHATQPTVESRPVLQQTAGGLHYLAFDGVDDFMVTETISDQFGKPFFACAGFQALGLAGSTSYLTFFGAYTSNTDVAELAARLSGGSVGSPRVYVRQGGGAQTDVRGASDLIDLAPHVITGAFQSGDVFLRTDGEERNRVARTIEDTFDGAIQVGQIGQPNNFYGGVYVVSNTVTQRQIESVEAFTAKKSGVTL